MQLSEFCFFLLWKCKEEDLVEEPSKLLNVSMLGIALLTLLILFFHLVTAHLIPNRFELFFMLSIFCTNFIKKLRYTKN